MATRDWNEPEGDEFGVEFSGQPYELNLESLFGDASALEPGRDAEDESRRPRELNEKEVHIVGVYEQRAHDGQIAYFVAVQDNRDRHLRIYIGQHEAYSISMGIEGRGFNRPLTHDLAATIIDRLGFSVDRVTVDDEYNGIYYAKLSLSSTENGKTLDVDCRPSDAIAVAVRAQAPLYVAEAVLESEGRKEPEI
jgi:bifunctional DNase/RNase